MIFAIVFLNQITHYFCYFKKVGEIQQIVSGNLVFDKLNKKSMNWTEPRKSQKSFDQCFSASKKIQTTCLNTPLFQKQYKSSKNDQTSAKAPQPKQKNCPYHFNNRDHVCLTCRKSICVRCAITYCQNHMIKQEKQVIPNLVQDLQKIYIKEKVDEIEIKLGQSLQRQEYFENKVLRLIEKVQENFQAVVETLNHKKLQIISHFDQQFQSYLAQYREYDQILKKKLIWLNKVEKQWSLTKYDFLSQCEKFTIEKIDQIINQIQEDERIAKSQKQLNGIMLVKNKLSIDKLWSQENLQKLLFEIQNIPFRMNKEFDVPRVKAVEKKKRIITECSEPQNKLHNSIHKSPVLKNMKGSGKIIYNKFNSARKIKDERLEKSELI